MKKSIKFFMIRIILFILNLSIRYTASFYPFWIENWYSNGLYRMISMILNFFNRIFDFSIGEYLFIFLILFILYKVIIFIKKIITYKKNRKSILLSFFISIFISINIIYFLFMLLWGLNYYRLPLSEITHLSIAPYSVEDLENLCVILTNKANILRTKVDENHQGIMTLKKEGNNLLEKANTGYILASNTYPILKGKYSTPKEIYFSNALSWMGISGIYSPFTGEANINKKVPDCMIPSTICHEMAHQRGFAREDEANYIAYITCKIHPDENFQYSGVLLALIHSMNALYTYDEKKYVKIRNTYSIGVKKDLENIHEFWEQYKGPIEETSSKVNDAYLKSNQQSDGIHSYGRMVDLLLAETQQK
ncbi:DUF3810 domain-containing protein [Inediibacterium massiliense]|uniref:DUF3810 domain-containing protein n=1 Tax=Inediibacterium massiliense TaxID=1658111 RepID=UPI0006B4338B|nr:DUF3810 domain-containing protein [Inediibacterium massiliense]